MDGLNLLHEVASGVPYLVPALGMGAETPVGTTLQCCFACKGTGTKIPPPLWKLPGVTERGRGCDEVMKRVVGIWAIQGQEHIRRLNPQTELGQGFIISLPFAVSASTK